MTDTQMMAMLGFKVCMTHKQIADSLGMSERVVQRECANGLKKVRKNIAHFGKDLFSESITRNENNDQ